MLSNLMRTSGTRRIAVRVAFAGVLAAVPLSALAIPASADATVPTATDVDWHHHDWDHHDRDHHDWDHHDWHNPGDWNQGIPFPVPFDTGSAG
ncbi:MAG: hypothetical protein JWN03_2343 [Nocardia sp.]|nr:hypothetical protein [Nocardia sp.]